MKDKRFKLPAKANLKGRSSTISNAFAISITPYIYPTSEEITKFYNSLAIDEGQCAYCLGDANAMDHIKPLVTNGLPTGYITDIHNLVPCCSACNSSKGKKDFSEWYLSQSNIDRLQKKGLSDSKIRERFNVITNYISCIGIPLNYQELLGDDLWNEYLSRRINLIAALRENQEFCDKLDALITDKLKASSKKGEN